MAKLLACPICGYDATLIRVGDNRDLFVYQCAECGYIKAKTSEARRTKWGARKVWNTRTKENERTILRSESMEDIKKAIKHFLCVKDSAVAVLDSGFGTNPNESNIVYKNRKLYAELAMKALEKQIPKKLKVEVDNRHGVRNLYYFCPSCNSFRMKCRRYCSNCGQALDWKETFRELGLKKAEENLENLMADG